MEDQGTECELVGEGGRGGRRLVRLKMLKSEWYVYQRIQMTDCDCDCERVVCR